MKCPWGDEAAVGGSGGAGPRRARPRPGDTTRPARSPAVRHRSNGQGRREVPCLVRGGGGPSRQRHRSPCFAVVPGSTISSTGGSTAPALRCGRVAGVQGDRATSTRASLAGTDGDGTARCWAVIAGGGTMGHLGPGVATAQELVARGCPPEAIHFVGSERGVEATRVPRAGFAVTLLPGRGIQRRPTLENVGAAWGLARAEAKALALLRRLRPAVVLATGGYASVPCALAAGALRIPLVVAEQNAVPGAANRLASRLAAAAATSFPGTSLRGAVVTGNPVRPEVLAVDAAADRAPARAALGVGEDRFLVVVFGGSLGARRLNMAAAEARELWRDRQDLALRHLVGDRDWPEFEASQAAPAGGRLQYVAVPFEEDMPRALVAADLVVCRAGASSVAELCAVGVPAVLVPLPGAPGDHQTANARVLAEAGAALLVPDAELDGARLAAVVESLLSRPGQLAAMRAASASLGRRDAASRVADLVERSASRPRPCAGGADRPTSGGPAPGSSAGARPTWT
ncbi:MAG: undecaprenyldiphospho-muramoylpentapeptide beta-N-acetylglucosaminyltransferase [Acidimicrobiia bacterium]|nr:undecaprenyldiphospho-muramoylpentapeptide beta-N-acetylglucosaminyltransferase [Acidimicrobiia bacterium]